MKKLWLRHTTSEKWTKLALIITLGLKNSDKVQFSLQQPYPDELKLMFDGNNEEANKFKKYLNYNCAVSLFNA